jgi:hypothetical protein
MSTKPGSKSKAEPITLVGVFEDGVIKLVDYSYRSPDEARQAWPQLGVIVVEGMRQSETRPLALPDETQKG